MKTEANDPANPVSMSDRWAGLTKREMLAAMAMQGFISAWGSHDLTDREDIAHDAVLFADALNRAAENVKAEAPFGIAYIHRDDIRKTEIITP